MKILLTGAEGLLGSAIMSCETTHEIVPITRSDVDLRNFEDTAALFRESNVDAVVHCAALVGGIGGNSMRSGDYFYGNTIINLNVLEAARLSGVNNLVSFMSTCVFPDDATYPLTPDQLHNGEPHFSNFGYAYSKRVLEVQTRAYNQQWGTKFKTLVPANMYGPHDNFSLNEGHVVPALIHKIYLAAQTGKDLEVWGSGNPLREFVYSGDIARLSLFFSERGALDNPVILTSGIEVSIRQLVDAIAQQMKFEGNIIWQPNKPDGQLRKPSSTESLAVHNPNFKFTSLSEGLSETIKWFYAHYPNVRV